MTITKFYPQRKSVLTGKQFLKILITMTGIYWQIEGKWRFTKLFTWIILLHQLHSYSSSSSQVSEGLPSILVSVIENDIWLMKSNKVRKQDEITTEILGNTRDQLWKALTVRFNHNVWKGLNTILLYEKGDKNLKTYCPI